MTTVPAIVSGVDASAVAASARVSLRDGRLTWASAPPVVLRRTGRCRVHVVAVGGGPLGGDRLCLEIDVGPGEELALHSAAATVVQPGRRPGAVASLEVIARVADDAALDWCPEPTVLTDGARWEPSMRVVAAAGARVRIAEQLVLGRSGQAGGRCASALRAAVDGRAVLATTTVLDGADPVLGGPGGTGGARSVGSVLLLGGAADDRVEDGGDDADVVWARSALAGPGTLLTAAGSPRTVAALLAAEDGLQRPA